MEYVVQQVKISELSGVRYVAKEHPINVDTDEQAKAEATRLSTEWGKGSEALLKRRGGQA